MSKLEELINDFEEINNLLLEEHKVSLATEFQNNYRKIILLSAASKHEYEITSILKEYVQKKSNNDKKIVNFLIKQAIEEKYHQLFAWNDKDSKVMPGKNANKFFGLFGQDFKNQVISEIKGNNNIKLAIESFIKIGHLRNLLIHSDLVNYEIENITVQDIQEFIKNADEFITFLKVKFEGMEPQESS